MGPVGALKGPITIFTGVLNKKSLCVFIPVPVYLSLIYLSRVSLFWVGSTSWVHEKVAPGSAAVDPFTELGPRAGSMSWVREKVIHGFCGRRPFYWAGSMSWVHELGSLEHLKS